MLWLVRTHTVPGTEIQAAKSMNQSLFLILKQYAWTIFFFLILRLDKSFAFVENFLKVFLSFFEFFSF